MFTEDDIRYHSTSQSFARGSKIARARRAIQARECTYKGSLARLDAYVASSVDWNERYRAVITFDAGGIDDYECSCPAYLKYDGMCKHCVAVALDFLEDPHSYKGWQEDPVQGTTPELFVFLEQAARAREADGAQTVDLIPLVTYGYGTWEIGYRITDGEASYVVKDLHAFVRALKTHDRVSYGAKLTFTHTLDSFSAHGRRHAEFLLRTFRNRETLRQTGVSSYHTPTRASARSLILTPDETVDLFDAVGAEGFQLKCVEGAGPRTCSVSVIDEDPHLALSVVEADGGYLLIPRTRIAAVRTESELYVLDDGCLYRCSHGFNESCGAFLERIYVSEEELFVSEKDMPLFGASLLNSLESALDLSAPPSIERYRCHPCELEFYFDRADSLIEVTAYARYGDAVIRLAVAPSSLPAETEVLRDRGDGVQTEAIVAGIADPKESSGADDALRDPVKELKALSLLNAYFYPDATVSLNDEAMAGALLYGGLGRFQALGRVFTTPAFDRLLSDRKPRIQIGLSLEGNLINLDVSESDMEPDELAALMGAYRLRKRYHRLKNGAILNLEELELAEFERLLEDLDVDPAELADGCIELPTYRAFYLNEVLEDAKRSDSFMAYIEAFKGVPPEKPAPPASLRTTLRPYQIEGFEWLSTLLDMGFGGILADEMGLGKSVQLIALMLARKESGAADGPTLVVCPASLVYNWVSECERFAPDLNVRAVAGTKRERMAARRVGDADVLITSYDLLRSDADDYKGMRFSLFVADEAQCIKNHATLTAKAVKSIFADNRLALTGTPVENRLSELWSIFDFLMPGLLGPYMKFRERFETGILGGNEEDTARFKALVEPFVLRRMKRDVLPEIPEKIEQTILVPLGGEQKKLYEAYEQRLRENLALNKRKDIKTNRVEVLAELTKLRQLCCDPHLILENYRGGAAKLDAISELIDQVIDSESKCLVFSQFTGFLDRIARRLDDAGIDFFTITGSTPKKLRVELVERFNGDDTPVFLISLKAGGTGLNLTGATTVIHADPWWNAAAQNQATDRAHRIGQHETVTVYKIIAKGSIEERIRRLQEAKAELADNIVGVSDGAQLESLSADDLMDLLA